MRVSLVWIFLSFSTAIYDDENDTGVEDYQTPDLEVEKASTNATNSTSGTLITIFDDEEVTGYEMYQTPDLEVEEASTSVTNSTNGTLITIFDEEEVTGFEIYQTPDLGTEPSINVTNSTNGTLITIYDDEDDATLVTWEEEEEMVEKSPIKADPTLTKFDLYQSPSVKTDPVKADPVNADHDLNFRCGLCPNFRFPRAHNKIYSHQSVTASCLELDLKLSNAGSSEECIDVLNQIGNDIDIWSYCACPDVKPPSVCGICPEAKKGNLANKMVDGLYCSEWADHAASTLTSVTALICR